MSNLSNEKKYVRLIGYSIAFIILIILVGIIFYYGLYTYKIIPSGSPQIVTEEIMTGVLGFLAITILGREIEVVSRRLFGPKRSNMILTIFRFIAYIVLALILLAIVGVSPMALLAGGTFAGLVLGLAAQTVLSNIIAGIMIILAQPYHVEDRITFVTWQYGLVVPSYPPKFYSQDSIIPGYSGKVTNIGLTYTVLRLDDGPIIKIPNSIMVVAAVVSHELKERWVRTKYEIPNSLDPKEVISILTVTLKKNEYVTKPDSLRVLINTTTATSYVISIDAICKGSLEEPPRSSILVDVMAAIKRLVEENKRIQETKT
jgi:small-conductance mechanosensitive channel